MEWSANGMERVSLKFEGEEQRPHFSQIMSAIQRIKANAYHGKKYEDNCRQWAKEGMQVSSQTYMLFLF